MKMWTIILAVLGLVGCSSPGTQVKPASTAPAQTSGKNSNPYAKYVELVGLRVNEKSAGHLEVQFAVVNHSEADLGQVKMEVNLRTTAAKPGDPPLITFSVKVPSLGPAELKPVTVDIPTKMRVYELPDWQFLKADFELTEPK